MDLNIQEAIDDYRIHHQLYPEYLQFEAGFSEIIKKSLQSLGHESKCYKYGGSVVQGIQTFANTIYGYSDPRKNGAPNGV